MALQEVVSRRQLLQRIGRVSLGLPAAALLGCEGDDNAEELVQKLLTTPFKEGELPKGLVSRGISAGNLDATSRALNAIGTVNIVVTEPSNPLTMGGIGYVIFKDKKDSPKGLDVAKSQFPTSSWQKVDQNGLPSSAVAGKIDSLLGSLHLVAAHVDNVLVMATYNNAFMAVQLEKSAIAHLKKIK